MAIFFPKINPVALKIGPVNVTWYGLSYLFGVLLGVMLMKKLNRKYTHPIADGALDDIITWLVLGIIIGGRLGYVLFYDLSNCIDDPLLILQTWRGGMSFHGGLIGVIIALYAFARYYRAPFWQIMDLASCVAPIGLCFGRIANFINGELYGTITDVPWAVVFPAGGPLPRHPSQLYESSLEGLLLLGIMLIVFYRTKLHMRFGMLSAIFLIGYGFIRIFLENFRESTDYLFYGQHHLSTGQLLSLPMVIVGILIIFLANKNDDAQERLP